jgi:SAM-dependent methyltransferase
VGGLVAAVRRRVLPPRAASARLCRRLLAGKAGLEVGGPSHLFGRTGLLPVYPVVRDLDNCNFAAATAWETPLAEGRTFRFSANRPPGHQYIGEATRLAAPAERYQFLLSSHVLEHVANPLLALSEWRRVLVSGGTMVLALPHREGTFDHWRPVTTWQHLMEDAARGIGEDDLTHLDEILALHDLAMSPEVGTIEDFRKRSLDNHANRCLHHHVFDTDLAVRLVDWSGLQVLAVEAVRPYHVIVVARKPAEGEKADNARVLGGTAEWSHHSPFPSDRHRRRLLAAEAGPPTAEA